MATKSGIKLKMLRLSAPGIKKVLGDLEAHIMEIVWREGDVTAREVTDILDRAGHPLSFNSVMTVMKRLEKKGILDKRKKKGVYFFSPVIGREDFCTRVASSVLASLLKDPFLFSPALFADLSEELDSQSLSVLKDFIRKANQRNAKR